MLNNTKMIDITKKIIILNDCYYWILNKKTKKKRLKLLTNFIGEIKKIDENNNFIIKIKGKKAFELTNYFTRKTFNYKQSFQRKITINSYNGNIKQLQEIKNIWINEYEHRQKLNYTDANKYNLDENKTIKC